MKMIIDIPRRDLASRVHFLGRTTYQTTSFLPYDQCPPNPNFSSRSKSVSWLEELHQVLKSGSAVVVSLIRWLKRLVLLHPMVYPCACLRVRIPRVEPNLEAIIWLGLSMLHGSPIMYGAVLLMQVVTEASELQSLPDSGTRSHKLQSPPLFSSIFNPKTTPPSFRARKFLQLT